MMDLSMKCGTMHAACCMHWWWWHGQHGKSSVVRIVKHQHRWIDYDIAAFILNSSWIRMSKCPAIKVKHRPHKIYRNHQRLDVLHIWIQVHSIFKRLQKRCWEVWVYLRPTSTPLCYQQPCSLPENISVAVCQCEHQMGKMVVAEAKPSPTFTGGP